MPLSPAIVGLAASAFIGMASVAAPAAATEATVTETTMETISYKTVDGQDLDLQIFRPSGSDTAPKPAIVLYHGGGSWEGGSVGQFQPQAEYLASRDMIAILVEHRPEGPVIATEDAIDAFNYVAEHTADLGIDPDRLAAGGGSSGGHLALSTALLDLPNSDDAHRPGALVLMNPVTDTSGRDEFTSQAQSITYSPFHHVAPGAPPTLLAHGTGDTRIDFADAAAFTDAMLANGNAADLVSYDGQPHGFFNPDAETDDRYFNETTWATDVFLGSLGYLDGPPTIRPAFDELVAGGDLESGIGDWYGTAGAQPTVIAEPVHQGHAAMFIQHGGAAQDLTAELAANGPGEYLFGGWLASATGAENAATVSLEVKGAGDEYPVGFPLHTVTFQPDEYAHVSGTRNVTWSGDLEWAALVVSTDTASGGLYADEVSASLIPA